MTDGPNDSRTQQPAIEHSPVICHCLWWRFTLRKAHRDTRTFMHTLTLTHFTSTRRIGARNASSGLGNASDTCCRCLCVPRLFSAHRPRSRSSKKKKSDNWRLVHWWEPAAYRGCVVFWWSSALCCSSLFSPHGVTSSTKSSWLQARWWLYFPLWWQCYGVAQQNEIGRKKGHKCVCCMQGLMKSALPVH